VHYIVILLILFYRCDIRESLTDALDNIRYPYKSLELLKNKIDELSAGLKQLTEVINNNQHIVNTGFT
jgi:hypothetical protein